jgi:ribosomal protein L7/L12
MPHLNPNQQPRLTMSRFQDDASDPQDIAGHEAQINKLFWQKPEAGDIAICDDCLREYTIIKGSKQQRRTQPKCPRCSNDMKRCSLTRVRLEKVKYRLGWKSADGAIRKWWLKLESQHVADPETLLGICQQLESKQATIEEFYNACKNSGVRGVLANLLFMEFMREKLAEVLALNEGDSSPNQRLPKIFVCGIPATADHGVAVILESIGDKKLEIVKVVKQMTGLTLMDCKRLVEQAPTIIGRCESGADASLVADALNAAGGHAYVD